MSLFAGAHLPAGYTDTVSTFLLKRASVLGSRQTLLFQTVSTPQWFWAGLCSLCWGGYWVSKTPPSRFWSFVCTPQSHWARAAWFGWTAFPSQCYRAAGPSREAEAQAANTDHEWLDVSAGNNFWMFSSVTAARSQGGVDSRADREKGW